VEGGGVSERLARGPREVLTNETLRENDAAVYELELRCLACQAVVSEQVNAHGLPWICHDQRRRIERRHPQQVSFRLSLKDLHAHIIDTYICIYIYINIHIYIYI